jgi:hypothetical protein
MVHMPVLPNPSFAGKTGNGDWADCLAEMDYRMVALADIRPGQLILEPSAGTGRIIDAIRRNAHGYAITAVELNCNMAHHRTHIRI